MDIPDDQAVGEVAESLLRVYRKHDAQELMDQLSAPVLTSANAQHQGLGNVLLAYAFARILVRECPADARDGSGVPRIDVLVGDGMEQPGDLDARIIVGDELGQPVSKSAAKGSLARFADAIPLTQRFMRVWTLSPEAVPDFVHVQSGRSPAMVDDVWGVLFQACANVRSAM